MSETILQIKRSTTTAVPANLQPGELAYTSNGQVLWVGSPEGSNTANVIAIAGERNPGVLTANQALVSNSSAWIDNVQTAKLIVGTPGTTVNVTSVITDGTLATVSNSALATAWAVKNYIDTQAGSSTLGGLSDVTITSPANNQLVVYDSISGQWENHSISGTANQATVTFDGQDITVGLASDVALTGSLNVGANVNLTTSGLNIGNSTVNASITAGAVAFDGTLSAGNTTIYGSATITGELIVGSNLSVNTTQVSVGNSTVNSTINATSIDTDGFLNVEGTARLGNTTIVGWANVSQEIAVGANVLVNTLGITVGNSTVNTQIGIANLNLNGSRLHVGDATNNTVITGVGIVATGNLTLTGTANVGGLNVGSDLNISTTDLRVGNSTVNTVVNSTAITTGTITTGNLSVTNAFSIQGDLVANGNVTLGNNASDNISLIGRVNTHLIPAANATYDLGIENTEWRTVYSNNIVAQYATFDRDVHIAGDLLVSGNVVTVNVSTLAISDPLIHLASNNTANTVDIGFVGHYSDDNGSTSLHTGIFRDATDGVYKIFNGLVQEGLDDSALTVNTAAVSYTVATLNAYLESGGLFTNSTAVQITANSTVRVDLVANTLALATALTVPNGGTGATSFTNNAILLGNTAGALGTVSSTTVGHVLQINSSGLPVFAMLDGGTF